MAIATTVGPFLDALRSQLIVRPNLIDVGVFTGWVGDDGGTQSIQFTTVHLTSDWAAIGRRGIEENYEIIGFIWVVEDGADEATISSCRTSAEAIYNELLAQLQSDPHVNGLVLDAKVLESDTDFGLDGQGRRAVNITFKLAVRARLEP